MKLPILETINLGHRFANGRWGLKHIDLRIDEGQFVVIAGANGSGKTTLLRHFNGLLLPTSGRVLVDGIEVSKDLLRARKIVQMVFQDTESQIVGETVRDEVAFGPENLGLPRDKIKALVDKTLEQTGLKSLSDTSPHLLSGGEKRRLTIAGVLAMKPRVVVLDEPFSNLDYPGVKMVLEQLLCLHRRKMTIVLCTHELEKVVAYAQRLVVLSKGEIVADGQPDKVIGSVERYGIHPPCSLKCKGCLEPWLS